MAQLVMPQLVGDHEREPALTEPSAQQLTTHVDPPVRQSEGRRFGHPDHPHPHRTRQTGTRETSHHRSHEIDRPAVALDVEVLLDHSIHRSARRRDRRRRPPAAALIPPLAVRQIASPQGTQPRSARGHSQLRCPSGSMSRGRTCERRRCRSPIARTSMTRRTPTSHRGVGGAARSGSPTPSRSGDVGALVAHLATGRRGRRPAQRIMRGGSPRHAAGVIVPHAPVDPLRALVAARPRRMRGA